MSDRSWCPVAAAARVLGDRWTLILLRTLANGPCRFKHLESAGEGISPAVLAARLRELEAHGMITRTSYNEIPPRVEYELTPKGRDALPVIEALRAYGHRWLQPECEPEAAEALSVRSGGMLPAGEPMSAGARGGAARPGLGAPPLATGA